MKVKIEKLDNFARGITYLNNKICFVDNALPNEVVEIEITKEKAKYLEAKVINYLEISPDRIDIDCPYYDLCGGCNLRHLSYDKENEYKQNKAKDLLIHMGKIDTKVNDIIYGDDKNYRNKVTFHSDDKDIGYYEKGTNKIISIDKCLLLDNGINKVISSLKPMGEDIIIRTSNDSKKILINEGNITTSVGDKKYYLSKDSFFQVNKYLTEKLYDLVRDGINKKYNNCLDLYCGTGSIGIYISDLVKNVIGVDYSKSNIDDALKNKELNNVNNIEFICDKVENRIDSFKDIDLIIVDPPRSGLDDKTRKYLKSINPDRIIYISCDPITLARDLRDLNDCYRVLEVTPINLFARTYHVESVTVLERQ